MYKITKYTLLLIITFLANSIFAQESLLWLTPKSSPTNFNNNQYECPLWKDKNDLVDLEQLKGNNQWIGLQSIIVRDINGDGYCDIFSGFSSSEEEKIPFLLFLYDSESGIFEDNSELIENNIGQKTSRKIVSADFNSDGILDFVAASHPEKINEEFSYLDVVISNSFGWTQETLYAPSRFRQEGYFHGVSVGDVDNDGDIDIVVANFHDSEGQFTLLNDGQANFERTYSINNSELTGEKEAFTNELFDIDSDGCLDLIYAAVNNRNSIAKIVYGTCDGHFGDRFQMIEKISRYEPVFIGPAYETPMDYNFHDIDNDGFSDLIILLTNYSNWRLVFFKNIGNDSEGKVIFSESSAEINADLLSQGFYTDDNSKGWSPYIELLDINNDGYDDIVRPKFFEGGVNFFPQNWVLFGNEGGLYTYANYPIATPLREISAKLNNGELIFQFETDFLSKINAHWSELDVDLPKRGTVREWIVYYSDSAFIEKNSDGTRRASILNQYFTLTTENIFGREESVLSGSFVPRLFSSSPLFLRFSYIDEYGVESRLSDEIVVEHTSSSMGAISGKVTTPAFHSFAPNPKLNLGYNNIGVFDSRRGKIFSCVSLLNNGERSTANYSLSITAKGDVFSITDAVLFNPTSLKNQNGELPSCSGVYESPTQTYTDTIQVGTETYRADFKIFDLNKLEMKVIEATRISP
ncbi:VCBS repeat-containing protein [Gammaproteobacteria bacterium]|nr:VCBS repeat-containing protein [Gammaproteobacteria bacterium]